MTSIPAQADTETTAERYARRRADPRSHGVAVEMAAQAYATWHGWDWPSLSDYYGRFAHISDPVVLELTRLELRQKVRHIARIMVDEFERHIAQGGRDREAECRVSESIAAQHAHDTTRRLQIKPKPPISSILAPRTGD